MFNKFIHVIFIIAITLSGIAFTTGCVTYYKSSDVSKSVNKIGKSIDKNTQSMNQDMKSKKDIYNELITLSGDKTIKPYPELDSTIQEMAAIITEYNTEKANYEAINMEMLDIAKKNKKIRSDKPEYARLKKLNDQANDQSAKMNSILKKYEKLSNSYVKILNDNKIILVKVADFRKQLKKNLAQLDKNIQKAKSRINALKKKNASKEKQLTAVENKLNAIAQKRKDFDAFMLHFEETAGDKKEILIAPGSKYSAIQSDFEKMINETKALINDYNKAADEL